MKSPEVDRAIAAVLGIAGMAAADDPRGDPAVPDLSPLMRLAGVGRKRARRLYEELGVRTLDDLEAALAAGRVQRLPGFGADLQRRLTAELQVFKDRTGTFALPSAELQIAPLLDYMRAAPGVERVEAAGRVRRRCSTVGPVDLLAVSNRSGPVLRHFATYPDAQRVAATDVTRGAIVLRSGLRVNLRIVPRRCFGATMHRLTGSVAHIAAVRQIGLDQGIRISDYGVFRVDQGRAGARRMGGQQEEDVFSAIGLDWIPPELREGRGEVEAAQRQRLPRLVTTADIRGDLHIRTGRSGGLAGIEQIALACRALGYEYCAITDVVGAGGTRGAGRREQLTQAAEIAQLRPRLDGLLVLHGVVAPIRPDGTLDADDTDLDRLDVVIAAGHVRTRMSRTRMTDGIIRALEHPAVDILANATGQAHGAVDPGDIDIDAVLTAAAALGVALEINARADRFDLSDFHARRAADLGAMIVINSAATSAAELPCMRFGVDQARRAWLAPGAVLNTMPASQLIQWLRRRRHGRGRLPAP